MQERIGKYEVIEKIASTRRGVIYKAQDPNIGRVVAIKTINEFERNRNPQLLERMQQEAKAAGNLRHPNIVTVFDVDLNNIPPYIVMDFIQGRTLQSILDAEGRLTPNLAYYFLSQICDAIDFAHSQGVLHRDIKPANIIIGEDDRLYVLDFGLALLESSSNATGGNVIVGTPMYMSPEQIMNHALDNASDLFSLTIVAYQMFTGRLPFKGQDYEAIMKSILKDAPLAFEKRMQLPTALEGTLQKGLNKDPNKRFHSANEMLRAITACFPPKELRYKPAGIAGKVASPSQPATGPSFNTEDNVQVFAQVKKRKRFGLGWFELSAFALILLGSALLIWSLRPELKSTETAEKNSSTQEDISNILQAIADDQEIDLKKSDATMTDTELLSALANPEKAEKRLVGLIAEAKKRNLPWLRNSLKKIATENFPDEVRLAAVEALSGEKDLEVAKILTSLLDDPSQNISLAAAKSLETTALLANLPEIKRKYSKISAKNRILASAIKETIEKVQGYPLSE